MNNTLAPLSACVPSADRSMTRVYLLSVRTRAGCSISKSYNQVGACNQRKEVCNSNYVSSLVDTRSITRSVVSVGRPPPHSSSLIAHFYSLDRQMVLYALLGTPPTPKSHIFLQIRYKQLTLRFKMIFQ